ncbi:nucleotidyltransferase domain-containing protein [soil metagenome]
MLKEVIQKNKEQFLTLCKSYGVKTLFVFGSAANGHFKDNSDLDFVVELSEKDPVNRGELLMSLWDKLEKFFNRKADLLTDNSIRNPYLRKEIEDTKKMVYDGSKEEILL